MRDSRAGPLAEQADAEQGEAERDGEAKQEPHQTCTPGAAGATVRGRVRELELERAGRSGGRPRNFERNHAPSVPLAAFQRIAASRRSSIRRARSDTVTPGARAGSRSPGPPDR